MGKVKKEVVVKDEVNLEDAAKLFQSYMKEKKELEKKADEQKKKLLEYAKEQSAKFEGNQLKFSCGVYVEKRVSIKPEYDEVGSIWMDKAFDIGAGDIFDIDLDMKEIEKLRADKKTAKKLNTLLSEINYKEVEKETLAVYC